MGYTVVNAEKATGYSPSREMPVLWAISKGSIINKIIIIPIAILLNLFFPIAIKYILVFGGVYLAYEGVEKIYDFLFHRKKNMLHQKKQKRKIKMKKRLRKQRSDQRSLPILSFP